jgi:hypothetical protein
MNKPESNKSDDSKDKRPLTDSEEAVSRENQSDQSGKNKSGSAKEKTDFDNPQDDPA